MQYGEFFLSITGHRPFPYQDRLATERWPHLLDVPTGLGKTASVLGAWLWKLLRRDPGSGRRLVYCLPMRSLVEQTAETARALCEAARDRFVARGHPSPGVHVLMGGSLDLDWEAAPERPAILVGTQDMLLSRALNRGYGASRYRWPVEFGLLSNDCLWVLDETQLQGVGVSTAAQLQGLRAKLGTIGPAHTLWMSATLGEEEIATVDHPTPAGGWVTHRLSERDEDDPLVRKRLTARKRLDPEPVLRLSRQRGDDAGGMAEAILQGHVPGSLTLAVSIGWSERRPCSIPWRSVWHPPRPASRSCTRGSGLRSAPRRNGS
jgi:CRISPR-associated endonuclease/helicase Cas3